MPLRLLNLDRSFPVADSFHASNIAGTVRFPTAADAFTLAVFQRVFGDVIHRFGLHEDAINAIVHDITQNPLSGSFDDGYLIRADGTVAFTGPVAGMTPETSDQLATKGYVDQVGSTISTSLGELGDAVTAQNSSSARIFSSGWVEHVWHAGQKDHLQFTVAGVGTPNLSGIASVSIVERLDIAQPTLSVPSPPARYVYSTLVPGSSSGFRLDAVWLEGSVVHALVPNVDTRASYPGVADWAAMAAPRARHLRAVVQVPLA